MKTIREKLEAREEKELSPFASRAARALGTKHPRKEDNVRTAFMHDRDRIIHCEAFRRLKDKTQVFLSATNGALRTRLTHTLEVTQIARTIARALALNEDLTEAIGLGHDVGHTPFGHAGERAIREATGRAFHHSAHSVRVVERLEKNGKGLNLTVETLDGILTHSKGKARMFSEENRPITLEGEIVRIADSIAYINHDIDDAIRFGILKQSDLPSEAVARLGNRHSERINAMVLAVIEESEGKPRIGMKEEILAATEALRMFMFERVYENERLLREGENVLRIFKIIVDYFLEDEDALNAYHTTEIVYDDPVERVIDFIAYQTDREIAGLFFKITGMSALAAL